MNNLSEKTPIRPILKEMLLNDKVYFPLNRSLVVRSTIHNLQDAANMKFTTRKNGSMKTLEVVRVN